MSKNKRQLRAEAVERLKELKLKKATYNWNDVIEAMLAGRDPRYTVVSQLIDLLTDEERPETYHDDFYDCESTVEADSREKLEADVRRDFGELGFGIKRTFEWLDRQAAIIERDCERKFNEAMGKEYSMRKELIAELDELRAGKWAKADNAIRELSEENDKLRVERDELREAFNAICDALGVPTDWKPIFSAGAATGEIEGMQRSAGGMHSKLARIKEVLDEWPTW